MSRGYKQTTIWPWSGLVCKGARSCTVGSLPLMDELGLAMVPERFSTSPAPLTYTGNLPKICKGALYFFEAGHLFPREMHVGQTTNTTSSLAHSFHKGASPGISHCLDLNERRNGFAPKFTDWINGYSGSSQRTASSPWFGMLFLAGMGETCLSPLLYRWGYQEQRRHWGAESLHAPFPALAGI